MRVAAACVPGAFFCPRRPGHGGLRPRDTRRLVRRALASLFVLAVFSSAAFATDYTVTKTADATGACNVSDCSLREAIAAANLNGGADRVVLGSGQTYQLSLGRLTVTDALTIDGNGSSINGAGLDRVLDVQGQFTVTINSLTITGGVASGFLSLGGGLNIRGAAVVLNSCTVTGNSTAVEGGSRDDGGGIAVVGSYNPATGMATLASLTLNSSTVSNNTGANGGGIVCVLCSLTISSSAISGNTAVGGDGAGVVVVGNRLFSGDDRQRGGEQRRVGRSCARRRAVGPVRIECDDAEPRPDCVEHRDRRKRDLQQPRHHHGCQQLVGVQLRAGRWRSGLSRRAERRLRSRCTGRPRASGSF
jgi:CSLREA domain-containing protein